MPGRCFSLINVRPHSATLQCLHRVAIDDYRSPLLSWQPTSEAWPLTPIIIISTSPTCMGILSVALTSQYTLRCTCESQPPTPQLLLGVQSIMVSPSQRFDLTHRATWLPAFSRLHDRSILFDDLTVQTHLHLLGSITCHQNVLTSDISRLHNRSLSIWRPHSAKSSITSESPTAGHLALL